MTTNLNSINYGIKQLMWRYKVDDKISTDLINNVNINFGADGNDKAISISQDCIQLYFLNKEMFDETMSLQNNNSSIIKEMCLYNFSLNPHCCQSSGDFFRNDYDVNIKHNFKNKYNESENLGVKISLVVNGLNFLRYYEDENKKIKCKYILSCDL